MTTTDEIYDEVVAAARANCCDDRRKPCELHDYYADGVERALDVVATDHARIILAVSEQTESARKWKNRASTACHKAKKRLAKLDTATDLLMRMRQQHHKTGSYAAQLLLDEVDEFLASDTTALDALEKMP